MKRLAITTLTLLALAGCNGKTPAEAPPTPVAAFTVVPFAGDNGARFAATIRPQWQIDLAFRVGGYVDSIRTVTGADGAPRLVQEGDVVSRGTALATVRPSDYADRAQQARAQVAEAEAAVANARSDAERARSLFASNALTRPELDGAETKLKTAEARLAGARAGLSQASTTLADASVVAPNDAVILRRSVERGALVAPGSPAFVLADTRSVKVVFGVPDVMVSRLAIGQRLSIETESKPGRRFEGSITRIAPSADTKLRVFEVELTIPNPQNELRSGMIASLVVPGEAAATAASLVVPLDAIVRSHGSGSPYAVYVIGGAPEAKVALRPVELGETYGNTVAVLRGLQAGERVVSRGASLLADGESVRVIE